MFRLNKKIAVITGGGSGIGKAIAKLFAKQGAIVHILEWNTDTANEAADEIKNDSGRSFVHKCNVADQKEVLAIFESIGSVNILVNNAGIGQRGRFADRRLHALF
jgi:NAD(P)-dependent dehydrogenase (short-subunit alcohol dehydrogenase family)